MLYNVDFYAFSYGRDIMSVRSGRNIKRVDCDIGSVGYIVIEGMIYVLDVNMLLYCF